jgi:hypothetical protein
MVFVQEEKMTIQCLPKHQQGSLIGRALVRRAAMRLRLLQDILSARAGSQDATQNTEI